MISTLEYFDASECKITNRPDKEHNGDYVHIGVIMKLTFTCIYLSMTCGGKD